MSSSVWLLRGCLRIRGLVGACTAIVVSAALPAAASEQRSFAQFRAQFYRALECRETDITTGFNTLGAITSTNADGALLARGFDASQLTRIGPPSTPVFEASIPRNRDLQQIFWTQKDELVLYDVAWFLRVRAAKGARQPPPPQKVLAEQS